MRAGWTLAALAAMAVPGAAGGAAPAIPAAGTGVGAPAVFPTSALVRLDTAADGAAVTPAEDPFSELAPALPTLGPAHGDRPRRFRFRDNGAGDMPGDPAAAFRLIAVTRPLLAAPLPRPGTRRARLLLPDWVQTAFGSWSIVAADSHTLNPAPAARQSWRSGFTELRTRSPRLSLGAEISHDPRDLLDSHTGNALTIGARYRLVGPLSLVVSGGPYVEHSGGTGLTGSAGIRIGF